MELLLYLLFVAVGLTIQYGVIRLAVTHAILSARKHSDPRSHVSGYVNR
jgi:hypothetical protein